MAYAVDDACRFCFSRALLSVALSSSLPTWQALGGLRKHSRCSSHVCSLDSPGANRLLDLGPMRPCAQAPPYSRMDSGILSLLVWT